MTVHPFPEPDPSPLGNLGSLFGISPMSMFADMVEALGDTTIGDVLDELRDIPIKDLYKGLLP